MTPPNLDARSLAEALDPLLRRVGGEVIPAGRARPDDIAVAVQGGPVVHVRLPSVTADTATDSEPADLSDGLARLIADVERELGGPLALVQRAGKQQAVRLLEERGAFEMRRSAETVAEALGVTRFTVYNYLNRRSTA
ncbi:MAG: helix-turn-helix domain-containing protein [Lapillicoccus sp.]